MQAGLDEIYKPSEDVVARDVHGEFIIIPITSGISESDEEIFSLNKFGKAIWDKLDGKRSSKAIAEALALEFEASETEIQNDVLGLLKELLKRKMIVTL
ncbi:MAG: PqqD family protein [Candidatus Omnitrophica bacterium]|nr:PqqD family protein [Candidatus Omnitrophota bacterium]